MKEALVLFARRSVGLGYMCKKTQVLDEAVSKLEAVTVDIQSTALQQLTVKPYHIVTCRDRFEWMRSGRATRSD